MGKMGIACIGAAWVGLGWGAGATTGGIIGFGSSARINPRLIKPKGIATNKVKAFRANMIVATPFAWMTRGRAIAKPLVGKLNTAASG
jgi:hypothetical protein